ncbi:MAG: hypothetical protein ACOCSM_00280 [Bacillota bacterium]
MKKIALAAGFIVMLVLSGCEGLFIKENDEYPTSNNPSEDVHEDETDNDSDDDWWSEEEEEDTEDDGIQDDTGSEDDLTDESGDDAGDGTPDGFTEEPDEEDVIEPDDNNVILRTFEMERQNDVLYYSVEIHNETNADIDRLEDTSLKLYYDGTLIADAYFDDIHQGIKADGVLTHQFVFNSDTFHSDFYPPQGSFTINNTFNYDPIYSNSAFND